MLKTAPERKVEGIKFLPFIFLVNLYVFKKREKIKKSDRI